MTFAALTLPVGLSAPRSPLPREEREEREEPKQRPEEEEEHTCPVEIVDMAPRTQGVLLETSGRQAGRSHALTVDVASIGRGEACGVRLDDSTLSRVHARIQRHGTRYVFEDAGSTNGSFVNDCRVVEPVQLRDGDRVRMGASIHLRFQLVSAEEERALAAVYDGSVRDPLTGAFNRRHLEERLVAELAYALRQGTELSVIILDLDYFKRVNDTFGHLAGDAVLCKVSRAIQAAVRTEDVVARYGGEEFVVALRGIALKGAVDLAERLRRVIEATAIPFEARTLHVTSSFGVASLACCAPVRDIPRLLGCADERLYRAKSTGRNRVGSG